MFYKLIFSNKLGFILETSLFLYKICWSEFWCTFKHSNKKLTSMKAWFLRLCLVAHLHWPSFFLVKRSTIKHSYDVKLSLCHLGQDNTNINYPEAFTLAKFSGAKTSAISCQDYPNLLASSTLGDVTKQRLYF